MRHLSYFNTNPYMGGFILGFVARLEETRAAAEDPERVESRIETLKKAMGAALAAVGDASIWGSLQPACAGVAALAAVVSWSFDLKGAAAGCALLYLALFNAPTLWLRWRGIELGHSLGEGLPSALQEWRWQRKARWTRFVGLACAAGAPLLLISREAGFMGWKAALPVAALVCFAALRRAGISSVAVYGLCLLAAFGWRGVSAIL